MWQINNEDVVERFRCLGDTLIRLFPPPSLYTCALCIVGMITKISCVCVAVPVVLTPATAACFGAGKRVLLPQRPGGPQW